MYIGIKRNNILIIAASILAIIISPWVKANMSNLTSNKSGIELQYFSKNIKPQDNFYQYVNGQWLKTTKIPSDQSSWGAFLILRDKTLAQLHQLVGSLARKRDHVANGDAVKIVTLYKSYMNISQVNRAGIKPLQPLFNDIKQLKQRSQLAALFARMNRLNVDVPMDLFVHQDAKDSRVMVADIYQGGLGLPDRDYYLQKTGKLADIKRAYQKHIEKMLALIAYPDANKAAKTIVHLETAMAKIHWTRVKNRDPRATYNKYTFAQLPTLAPHINWKIFNQALGIDNKVNYLVISQPSYIKQLDQLIQQTPMSVWRAYLTWQLLKGYAKGLPTSLYNESFDFYGKQLMGVKKDQPRWKNGIAFVENSMGEALGRFYVARYFPPKNKQHALQMVDHLIQAYYASINQLSWMGEKSKQGAKAKLDHLMVKIGYPEKWRNYNKLIVKENDLIGNAIRANEFNYRYMIDKLGRPADRSLWEMTPQTVNAYYDPEKNEIVFPAAILQPPFFNINADMAVNYGGIGAVIGHELSHGFDDEGGQYDAYGNLNDWMTPQDHKKFKQLTQRLVAQYDQYQPIKGYHVNGQLTLGENIADNSGLAIAYKAYVLSLHGGKAKSLDGFTGAQRFYIGWSQVYRGKTRLKRALMLLKIDPHSPDAVRGNAPLRNQNPFYEAFNVKPADKMYLPPDDRVHIW
jgi:predicted metalloendopeptidase